MQNTRKSSGVWSGLATTLRGNWLHIAIFIGLVILPHYVGWTTDSSPFGMQRGDRMLPRGASTFWQSIFIELFVLAILAMSYNLIFGFTGFVSFGHALFFGLGGYILGVFLQDLELIVNDTQGWLAGTPSSAGVVPIPIETKLILGVIIALVVASFISFLVGLVSLRIRGVYFAIFTLAVAEMFFIYFGRFPATKADDGFALSSLPPLLDSTSSRLSLYYITLALFVITFLFIRRLINSPTGAIFLAIRENEERAKAIGYNTLRYKLIAITIAGALAAVAGMLHVLLNKKVGPEILGVGFTLEPLLMSIIGGVGTFSGPVIGTAMLHLSDRMLRDAQLTFGETIIDIGASWDLILGIFFIVVVMVFPQGVIGTWNRWRANRKKPDQ